MSVSSIRAILRVISREFSRERRESLLEEYDRSGMSGARFAKYVGIKYTTLAYRLKRRRHPERERPLMKAEVGTESGRSSGRLSWSCRGTERSDEVPTTIVTSHINEDEYDKTVNIV
jgi:hypothetical protein